MLRNNGIVGFGEQKDIYYNIKTAFILIDWTSFMNSEYWLGREVGTWNDAQVIVNASSLY